ncbi:MAG: TetR/AcrR family transcriptional regulator [Saccharospirillum sp.]
MSNSTRDRILAVSRDILIESGAKGLTFDSIAERLGITRQAVIYWFANKQLLLRALVLPWIRAEAETLIEAIASANSTGETIEKAVQALMQFHLGDLDRFRQVYLGIQLDARPVRLIGRDTLSQDIHPVTGKMYQCLAESLSAGNDFGGRVPARQAAVSLHFSVLGHCMMIALGDAIEDPLAQPASDLSRALIYSLARGICK